MSWWKARKIKKLKAELAVVKAHTGWLQLYADSSHSSYYVDKLLNNKVKQYRLEQRIAELGELKCAQVDV